MITSSWMPSAIWMLWSGMRSGITSISVMRIDLALLQRYKAIQPVVSWPGTAVGRRQCGTIGVWIPLLYQASKRLSRNFNFILTLLGQNTIIVPQTNRLAR